jgi:antitoxin CptB
MSATERQARLKWNCRRGMLELDIILGKFLNEYFPGLSESDKTAFENLLACQDQDLFNWLVHKQIPTDPSCVHIVAQILAHVSTAP